MTEVDFEKIKEEGVNRLAEVTVQLFKEAIEAEDFEDFFIKNNNLPDKKFSLKDGRIVSYNDAFEFVEEPINNETERKKDKINKKFLMSKDNKENAIKELEKEKNGIIEEIDKKITNNLDDYVTNIIDSCDDNNGKILIYYKVFSTLQKLNNSMNIDNRIFCGMVGWLEKFSDRLSDLQKSNENFQEKFNNLRAKIGNKIIDNISDDDIVYELGLLTNLKTIEKQLNDDLSNLKSSDKIERTKKDLKEIQEQEKAISSKIEIFSEQLSFLKKNMENFTKLAEDDTTDKILSFKNLEKQYKEDSLVDRNLVGLYSMAQKWQKVHEKIKDSENIDEKFRKRLGDFLEEWENKSINLQKVLTNKYIGVPVLQIWGEDLDREPSTLQKGEIAEKASSVTPIDVFLGKYKPKTKKELKILNEQFKREEQERQKGLEEEKIKKQGQELEKKKEIREKNGISVDSFIKKTEEMSKQRRERAQEYTQEYNNLSVEEKEETRRRAEEEFNYENTIIEQLSKDIINNKQKKENINRLIEITNTMTGNEKGEFLSNLKNKAMENKSSKGDKAIIESFFNNYYKEVKKKLKDKPRTKQLQERPQRQRTRSQE